ncbi:EsaB/YukD family protein [Alkalicoccobacillus murimartini]|uniref:Ubiquitin-like protein YukD n=1 Tax=Alkalicoccobacillus murimartini TaxID=171685 RepID=A0ABT9YL89_9BACI|nr:EsaB/YukD family protein [Alkalicoccobacillus murimartini]MDQ0208511.1 putative ubiquitin-like protein YukD [Alkalicoccobacillus murimartini]
MYIVLTIDMSRYDKKSFDIRLSDQYTVKELIDITWQMNKISDHPTEGHWIKIVNKKKVLPHFVTLSESGVTTGDRLRIL